MKYWLMKSEPSVYSISDLKKDGQTYWECVRNYQARNFMTRDMQIGDLALFYHSNAQPSGVAGLMKVCGAAVADPTQFQKKSDYFDGKATPDNPIWFCIQVQFLEAFERTISLDELRTTPGLSELLVLKKGQRLSIQPVTKTHFDQIMEMAAKKSQPPKGRT